MPQLSKTDKAGSADASLRICYNGRSRSSMIYVIIHGGAAKLIAMVSQPGIDTLFLPCARLVLNAEGSNDLTEVIRGRSI